MWIPADIKRIVVDLLGSSHQHTCPMCFELSLSSNDQYHYQWTFRVTAKIYHTSFMKNMPCRPSLHRIRVNDSLWFKLFAMENTYSVEIDLTDFHTYSMPAAFYWLWPWHAFPSPPLPPQAQSLHYHANVQTLETERFTKDKSQQSIPDHHLETMYDDRPAQDLHQSQNLE